MFVYNETFDRRSWCPSIPDCGSIITQTLGGLYYLRIYTDPNYTSTVPYTVNITFP
jgi:hypothetical protein